MKRNTLIILTIALVLGALVFTGCRVQTGENTGNQKRGYSENGNVERNTGINQGNNQKGGQGPNGGGGVYVDIDSLPKEDLSEDEVKAMTEALMDEYKARDFYTLVIEKFGEVDPFVNIKRAEETHIDALKKLFEKYGLQVPEDSMMDEAEKLMENVEKLEDACKIGVQAEIENKEMYDRLFKMVNNQDIERVFTSLRDASQNQHLPAFERCAEGNYNEGNEVGKSYRRGRD